MYIYTSKLKKGLKNNYRRSKVVKYDSNHNSISPYVTGQSLDKNSKKRKKIIKPVKGTGSTLVISPKRVGKKRYGRYLRTYK